MMKRLLLVMSMQLCLGLSVAADDYLAATDNAQVYFISPQDGAIVGQAFSVKFGLKGMGVAPAGTMREHTGHHHLLINMDINDIDMNKSLPATEQIKHFGGGQTEAVIELAPGTYSLQLLLGNYAHVPHDKPVLSEPITVRVE